MYKWGIESKTIWRRVEGNSNVECKCAMVVPDASFLKTLFKLAKNLSTASHLHVFSLYIA